MWIYAEKTNHISQEKHYPKKFRGTIFGICNELSIVSLKNPQLKLQFLKWIFHSFEDKWYRFYYPTLTEDFICLFFLVVRRPRQWPQKKTRGMFRFFHDIENTQNGKFSVSSWYFLQAKVMYCHAPLRYLAFRNHF